MSTNWINVTGANLSEVLNWDSIIKANQNLADGTNPDVGGVDTDNTEPNRRDQAVLNAIADLRAAIASAGRYPLAVTTDSIPPGSRFHVLAIAAWRLLNSTPNINMAILTEKGVAMPYAQFYKDGMAYLEKLGRGQSFPPPTDPTGVDYLTAISATNPAIRSIRWADNEAEDTDYDAGFYTDPAGGQISLPNQNMNTF